MIYPKGNIEQLKGLTIVSVVGAVKNSEQIIFRTNDDRAFKMWHDQDCCENVSLEDVCGDIEDLLDSPIIQAEEVSDILRARPPKQPADESHTWTFYKLGTAKGSVTLRWYGTSNGCYSESVDFMEVSVR